MSLDEITVKDGKYGTVSYDSKLKSNRIPTRETSFMKIKNFWNKKRRERLANKLEKEKQDLVSTGYEGTKDEIDAKIYKKSTVIARLEKEINIIDRKTIPVNYVKRRAILIKKSMSENLLNNGYNAYFVTKKVSGSVFDKIPGYGSDDVVDVKELSEKASSSIKSEIESSVSEKEREEQKEDIKPVEVTTNKVEQVTRDDIDAEIDSYLESISKENEKIKQEIDVPPANDSVESIADEKTEEPVLEEEDEVDEYTPLTDDEIEEARREIGLSNDKTPIKPVGAAAIRQAVSNVGLKIYNNESTGLIQNETPAVIRDEVVVVPEKTESKEVVTKEAVTEAVSAISTPVVNFEEFNLDSDKEKLAALMNKLEKLKVDKKKAEEDEAAAKKIQAQENEKAAAVRKDLMSRKEMYKLRASKIEQMCSVLESDILNINQSAKVARDDAECNSRFVKSQEKEIQDYDDMMKEMESIIGTDPKEEIVQMTK